MLISLEKKKILMIWPLKRELEIIELKKSIKRFKCKKKSSERKALKLDVLCFKNRQPEVAARKLGINSSFIKGDYCYVLVRVSRFRETARLAKPIPPNQVLQEDVSERIQNMTPGNSTETIQFMTTFGTHYINSYVTGNSLYQVRWASTVSDFFFFSFHKYIFIVMIPWTLNAIAW